MKKKTTLLSIAVLSLFLILTVMQTGLADNEQEVTGLLLEADLEDMTAKETEELVQLLMGYLDEGKITLDELEDVLGTGNYRFAEEVELELQARIMGLDSQLREQIRLRLKAINSEWVTRFVCQALKLGIDGERLALELQQREKESNEALEQHLRNMIQNQIQVRLQAHSENGDCQCEECRQLRQQLQECNCINQQIQNKQGSQSAQRGNDRENNENGQNQGGDQGNGNSSGSQDNGGDSSGNGGGNGGGKGK